MLSQTNALGANEKRSNRWLDFQNPLQAAKWLSLLQEEPISGIRVKPNLRLDADYLGFSFDSNEFGLRGPCSQFGTSVVLGTSFAMGFGVNVGSDWYAGVLDDARWFNAGLPVGPFEWAGLLDRWYRGRRQLALFIYHPNVWQHGLLYLHRRKAGKGAFETFGWSMDAATVQQLFCRKRRQQRAARKLGKVMHLACGNACFSRLDAGYCVVDAETDAARLDEVAQQLKALLLTFDKVICLRVPIKEQLLPSCHMNNHFLLANRSHDRMWRLTTEIIASHPDVHAVECSGFSMSDYHPLDSHLNCAGNQRLGAVIQELLAHHACTDGVSA
ncbi:MAG: hypothetical protein KF778_17025 [Rhodocyclaceae bacterium]|nr:hypothetical protein [Rhodocyclaceae bacterium]